jgi:hypothetical protein
LPAGVAPSSQSPQSRARRQAGKQTSVAAYDKGGAG